MRIGLPRRRLSADGVPRSGCGEHRPIGLGEAEAALPLTDGDRRVLQDREVHGLANDRDADDGIDDHEVDQLSPDRGHEHDHDDVGEQRVVRVGDLEPRSLDRRWFHLGDEVAATATCTNHEHFGISLPSFCIVPVTLV